MIRIKKKDLKRDVFRCPGNGGQKVNKTSSGVRYTHEETGITAQSCEHRSQSQNDKRAWEKIAQLLVEHFVAEDRKERYAAGTEIVRTYNFEEDRIKDHSSGQEYSPSKTFDKGKYPFIEDRMKEQFLKNLANRDREAIYKEFKRSSKLLQNGEKP